jgi:2-oxoglutarate dehydrogenase complex dehydrogenase (E1) component-like enzyme
MHRQIRKVQTSSSKQYGEQLISAGVVDQYEIDQIKEVYNKHLESEFEQRLNVKKTLDSVRDEKSQGAKTLTGKWSNINFSQFGKEEQTGISKEQIKNYLSASINVPPTFSVHPRIKKYHIEDREKQIQNGALDWASAEAVALASIVDQGFNVRFTGQDVERGTFSHRHLVLTDQETEMKWSPLSESTEYYSPKGRFHLGSSPLSELGALGFEYGYSLENPNNMVIWEAQFGDFFNPAQVKINYLLFKF